MDFQDILNVYKKFGIFNFKGHMCLLWSCMYPNKIKRIVIFAYLVEKQVKNDLKLA